MLRITVPHEPVTRIADGPLYPTRICYTLTRIHKGAICWRRMVVDQGVSFALGSCFPAVCCHALQWL